MTRKGESLLDAASLLWSNQLITPRQYFRISRKVWFKERGDEDEKTTAPSYR